LRFPGIDVEFGFENRHLDALAQNTLPVQLGDAQHAFRPWRSLELEACRHLVRGRRWNRPRRGRAGNVFHESQVGQPGNLVNRHRGPDTLFHHPIHHHAQGLQLRQLLFAGLRAKGQHHRFRPALPQPQRQLTLVVQGSFHLAGIGFGDSLQQQVQLIVGPPGPRNRGGGQQNQQGRNDGQQGGESRVQPIFLHRLPPMAEFSEP